MSAFELSWYIKIDKQRNCGVNPKATLKDSLPQIKTALDHSGVVSISLFGCPKYAPRRLQLQSTNGNSTLTLGYIDNHDECVKGYSSNYLLPKVANSRVANSRVANSRIANSRIAKSRIAKSRVANTKADNDDIQAIGSDKKFVCSKPETIYEIVEEFFTTGNVSGEWLN